MNRSVVTGGAGFIGSHLVDSLVKSQHEVLIIDDFSTGLRQNIEAHLESHQVQLVDASILSDTAIEAVTRFKPQQVFHLAAQMNVRKSVEDPIYDAERNVVTTVALLQALKSMSEVTFIFSSTGGAIYGEQETFPATESHRTEPECPYGVSKLCCEHYLSWYARSYGMKCAAVRFGNVYGPRQNPAGEAGVVAIFLKNLLDGKPLYINGDGNQTRDFIYVEDVVTALSTLGANYNDSEGSFQVFNLGTGIETSVNEIAHALKDCSRTHVDITHREAAPGEQRRSLLDAQLFQDAYGWKPKYDLNAGLLASYHYAKEQL